VILFPFHSHAKLYTGKITNNPNASMEYVNYDVAIREAKGIELAGVPSDVKVDKHADWNVETGPRIREMLRTALCTRSR
jgi:hypothetical protein